MAVDVTMPRLSDSMEEGTVLRWLKSVGDEVKRGDELVEIETDKANMTYEATDEGVLIEIVAEEGDTLPIGEAIARIGDAGRRRRPSAGKPADGSQAGRSAREKPSRSRRAGSRSRASARQRASAAPAEPTATGASRHRRSRAAWRAT